MPPHSLPLAARVAEHAPSPVAYIGRDERFVFANTAYRAWAKADASSLIGKLLAETCPPDEYAAWQPHLRSAFAGEEVSWVMRAGKRADSLVTCSPDHGPDGQVRGLLLRVRAAVGPSISRESDRLRLLAQASEVLSSSLDWEVTLRNVIDLALPAFGDFAFFDVVDRGPDDVRRLARAYRNPELEAALQLTRWERSQRTDMNLCALSSGETGLHPDIDEAWCARAAKDEQQRCTMVALAIRSMLTVPLRYAGRLLGSLTLFHGASGRHHTADDQMMCEELARRAAAAVENARLYRDLKVREDAARESDRQKGEFLAILSHELRNPLAPIVNALDLLDQNSNGSTKPERGILRRQVDHLARLVDDLLDVSRVSRGKLQLMRRGLRVEELVARAVEMTAPALAERHHVLRRQVEEGLRVDGDEHRLIQVVTNLLTNAAKYTLPGGQITLSARGREDVVELKVQDDGIGIAPDLLPHLFDTFFQGSRRDQPGLGLGLTIARNLAKLHGGDLTAHSAGPGKGSEFTLTLPRLHARTEAQPAPLGEVPLPAAALGAKVLVVDDNHAAATTLAMLLRTRGFEVRTAFDATAAVEAFREFGPRVAVLDIGLPGVDGYELARQLQAAAKAPVKLVALTGHGQETDRLRAEQAGFAEHLVKPVHVERIEEVVARLAILR